MTQQYPEPPSTKQLLMEFPRASCEMIKLADWRWHKLLDTAPAGDGHPVMTIPGFGGGDGSMALLRRFLTKLGYQAEPWGLGTNLIRKRVHHMDEILEFCTEMENAIAEQLEPIVEKTGKKVSLVGWSLGGVYANALAQTHPHLVRQVVTLGSPIGDPRGTSTWNILKKLNGSDVPDHMQNVDGWMTRKDLLGEREVRTSILYSLADGAVSKGSAILEDHNLVENIEVPSSHIGFAHNPVVYWVIADRLSQDHDNWNDFVIEDLPKRVKQAF